MAKKIALITLFLSFLGTFLLGWYSFTKAIDNEIINEFSNLKSLNNGLVSSLKDQLKNLESDIRFLSVTPPITGIIRAYNKNNYDELGKSSLKVWKERLETIFENFLSSKSAFESISYIENGPKLKEIIKNEKIGIDVIRAPESELREVQIFDKFEDSNKLKPGVTNFSAIYAKRVNGNLSYPITPMITAILPIYSKYKNIFGYILVELNLNYIFENLKNQLPEGFELLITNKDGYYVYNKNNSAMFSFEFKKDIKIQNEISELQNTFVNKNQNSVFKNIYQNILYYFNKAFINENLPDRFLGVFISVNTNQMFYQLMETKQEALIVGFFLVIFLGGISYFLISYYLKPLKMISNAAEDYSNGLSDFKLPEKTNDEIGVLASAFEKIINEVSIRTFELKENQLRTNAILDNTVDAIITIDTKGIIQIFNKGAENIFGYTSNESLGKNINFLMPSPYQEEHDGYLENYINSGISKIIGIGREVQGKRKDGTVFPIYLSVSSVIVGEIQLFTGLVRDISVQKQTEYELEQAKLSAEDANRAKSNFLSNMSHELRTPLNGILGFTDILLGQKVSEIERENLNIIKGCGESLLGLINEVLDFTRIESGALKLEIKSVNLLDVIESVNFLYVNRFSEKNISFYQEIPKDIPKYIKSDGNRLRQVLSTLISNAIKFTESGSVTLKIQTKILNSKESEFKFSISDTGIGMAPNIISKLFKPFTQGDDTSTRKYGGTGLGLSVSKKIVELFGGEINGQNNFDKGCTFSFTIKAEVIDSKAQDAKVSTEKIEYDQLGIINPLKILVAEDNFFNQKFIIQLLENLKFKADLVSNGVEAVEQATGSNYDVILMDIQMPLMNGLDATKKIIELIKDNPPTIIGLTANVSDEDQKLCADAGMIDFVAKPVKVEELVRALKEVSNKGKYKKIS